MSPRDTAFNALLAAADRLGRDELLVLAYQADRMVSHQEQYGDLNLSTDTRDMDDESLMEIADYLNYRAFKILLKMRGR